MKQTYINKVKAATYAKESTMPTPTTHTPGPWTVLENDEEGLHLLDPQDVIMAEHILNLDTARVIAAAPALYAALEKAQCDLDALKLLGQALASYDTTRIAIRAALAAADGKVQP